MENVMNTCMALQNKLIGDLIGLARATDGNTHLITASTNKLVLDALSATMLHVDADALLALIQRVDAEKHIMVPNCFDCASPCGRTSAYDMQNLQNANEEVRALKQLILLGLRGLACDLKSAFDAEFSCDPKPAFDAALPDSETMLFFYEALFAVGMDSWGTEELLPVLIKMGNFALDTSV